MNTPNVEFFRNWRNESGAQSVSDITEDIASREEDAACIERELREIERELPKMQMRQLELQRDLAISRLAILKLENKLAEVTK